MGEFWRRSLRGRDCSRRGILEECPILRWECGRGMCLYGNAEAGPCKSTRTLAQVRCLGPSMGSTEQVMSQQVKVGRPGSTACSTQHS